MSEQAFKEAKGQLALSQSLRDTIMRPSMGEQDAEMPHNDIPQPIQQESTDAAPFEGTETPNEEEAEKKSIIEGVKEAIQPMIDEVKSFFEKKEEPKEVEIKIGGEMAPKEDTEA